MVAEFTVNHGARNQMIMRLGLDNVGVELPTTTWTPTCAFYGSGGPYAFDGTTTACDGTFWLDYETILPASGEQALVRRLRDVAGAPTGALKAFRLYRTATAATSSSARPPTCPRAATGITSTAGSTTSTALTPPPRLRASPPTPR